MLWLNQIGFVYALKTTSASVIALILAATPIFAALIGLAFGTEGLPRRFWVGAALSFAGVGLVALGAGGELGGDIGGILLGILTAATWAVYSILVTPLMQRYSPSRISAVVLSISWVGIALDGLAADALAGLAARLGGLGAVPLRDARPARDHEHPLVQVARPDRRLAGDARDEPAAVRRRPLRGRAARRADRRRAGRRRPADRRRDPRRAAAVARLARASERRVAEYAAPMSPQRRTALVSVGAAVALMGIKLGTGLASGSLGLVSEALHSGTDLVAALLTFFAIGVAGRPADRSHPYGHGKAEHLAALAEAFVLLLVSIAVGALAVARLVGWIEIETSTAWWVFAAVGVVIAIDVSRTVVSVRAARRFSSPALASNALHFGSDLAGTLAVLVGLLAVRAGWPAGDSLAALFVAFLVVTAAARLIRRNVDVLMDRAPADAVRAARAAIATLDPPVEVRRLRLREAAGRTFTDVVIGVSPGAAVGQGHAVADRVEAAVQGALPGQRRRRPRRAGRVRRRRCASGCARRRCRSRASARSTTSP